MPSPTNVPPLTMTFPQAMQSILDGQRITRLEWKDRTSVGEMRDGYLMLRLNGTWYQWIVSDGDMVSEDWIVVE